ncbi:MAG TPA: glycogen debranching N-terminal domain-containing protein [Bryobacteraceae bacterium]|nr:glycogen debranching N-terminal domain-containing protein [Bryobacteraceae bacterium]
MRAQSTEQLIQLRPRTGQHYISLSHSVFITGSDGFIREDREEGLLIYQTRTLSRYRWLIDGKPPRPVALSPIQENNWLGYYISPAPGEENDSEQTVELRLSRCAGHGLHEEADLTNYTQKTVHFTLELEVDADFVDQSEMGSGKNSAHGSIARDWRQSDGRWELFFDFHAEHAFEHQGESGVARVHQSIALRVEHSDSDASYQNGRILFAVELRPHASWHACIDAIPTIGDKILQPLYRCRAFANGPSQLEYERDKFLIEDAARFSSIGTDSLAASTTRTITRASRDLAALRMYDLSSDGGWVVAAGMPKYLALFGRDALSASWQASLLSTAMLRGVLPVLASLQGKEDNPWRDEQPEKMIHQAASGLRAELNFTPYGRYYGSLTTSAVYPFALAALWQWTGDVDLVRRHLDPALKALHWRDTVGDMDGDGFGEYQRRSEGGLKNQGWKDSGDAIVYPDGSQVEDPIAPCEEQGFLYIAKVRMAEMLWWIGDHDLAKKFFHQASELKKKFNDAFWMEDEGFFAMGLDRNKRQIRSIASNAGHLLETAIVDDALARRTADRLMCDDLFSGWGVRTLSAGHPAYNPFSYQRGSVWPVEQGLFALGMLRFGFHHYVERLARAQFELAALFEYQRLPELIGGQQRDPIHPFPAVYPEANWPQAWSAAGVFCLLYSLLGTFPYAPLKTLFVDPHLPEWMPEITIENMHIGQASAAIRFFRTKDGRSDFKVLEVQGDLHVIRQPSPWSLTATFGERFVDVLTSLTPGR